MQILAVHFQESLFVSHLYKNFNKDHSLYSKNVLIKSFIMHFECIAQRYALDLLDSLRFLLSGMSQTPQNILAVYFLKFFQSQSLYQIRNFRKDGSK